MNYSFKEKSLDPKQRIVIFEAVPPEPHINEKSLKTRAKTLALTLNGYTDVDAICIPQVIDEQDRGNTIARNLKVSAREFACYVRKFQRKDVIITHPFPYTPKEQTEEWIKTTYNVGKIKNIVIVGPTHNYPNIPGYGVNEASQIISKMNKSRETDIFHGGICIDSRRKKNNPNLAIDEPERMVKKAKAGIQYFINQISYEPESVLELLRDYRDASEKEGEIPRRVILSVSPISSTGTLKVVENLIEKEINPELKRYITSRTYGITERSEQRIEEMFRRIFEDYYTDNIGVPIGICVEYITATNFESSLDLLHRLPKIWREYKTDSVFSNNNSKNHDK